MWSPLVRKHRSDHLLWSIFPSSLTHITHYKSCWTFFVGSCTFLVINKTVSYSTYVVVVT